MLVFHFSIYNWMCQLHQIREKKKRNTWIFVVHWLHIKRHGGKDKLKLPIKSSESIILSLHFHSKGNNIHFCSFDSVHGMVLTLNFLASSFAFEPSICCSTKPNCTDASEWYSPSAFSIFGAAVRQLFEVRWIMFRVWKSYDQSCRGVSAQFTIRASDEFLSPVNVSNASKQMPSLAIICVRIWLDKKEMFTTYRIDTFLATFWVWVTQRS